MFARSLILLHAIRSHSVFFVSFVCADGFTGNYLAPKSIDIGEMTAGSKLGSWEYRR